MQSQHSRSLTEFPILRENGEARAGPDVESQGDQTIYKSLGFPNHATIFIHIKAGLIYTPGIKYTPGIVAE